MDEQQVATPLLPEHAAHLAAEPELVAAWGLEVAERQAQAAKVESLLAYKARKLEQSRGQHAFTRRAVEKAITRDAATVLGLSAAAVRRLLGGAEFLTQKLPQTWNSYQQGVIDRERAAKAAQAVEDIAHRQDLLPMIDDELAQRAPGENATTLQKWATRRVQELDAAGFQERYDRAQAKRYVSFRHRGDGMSRIDALIPTLVAAGLEQQIYAQARNAPRILPAAATGGDNAEGLQGAGGPDGASLQERTLSQRIADAFIDRLHTDQPHTARPQTGPFPAGSKTTGEGSELPGVVSRSAVSRGPVSTGPSGVKIGVLVPVQTLTGDSDAPALSWDRTWSVPAGTAREIALDPDADHDWYIAGTTQSGISAASGQDPVTEAVPEILTVVHPPKIPAGQSLQEWISGADPDEGNLLSRAYRSRTSRDRQRDAILIRDGQCTQPGCANPGWQAEIDHTQSHETGGQTSGENLRVLCRDCHSIKSHRLNPISQVDGARQPGRFTMSGQNGLARKSECQRSPSAALGTHVSSSPARASPADENLPEWLTETRPPPDWAVEDAV